MSGLSIVSPFCGPAKHSAQIIGALTQSGHFRHFLSAVRHTLLMRLTRLTRLTRLMRLTRAIGLLRAFRLLAFPALTIALTLTLSIGVMPSANAEPQRLFPIEASAKCPVKFAQYHHDYPATDIITRKGCKFLAPIDGVVDEVSRKDSWSGKSNRGQDRGGLFVSLLGSDGVRYYGSHLMEVAPGIEPGVAVMAGDVLGKVGTSGSARGTAPHLHFGLSWPTKSGEWKIRRGAVLPYKYLQSWQRGENLSPVAAVNRAQIRLPQ